MKKARRAKTCRAEWTEFVEGKPAKKKSKYKAVPTNGYASKHEAEVAVKLEALASRGMITELEQQVSFTLVPAKGKTRAIRYVADFTYRDLDGVKHVVDAKGYAKNRVYLMKKKMMLLLLGIEIEEV